MWKSAPTCNIPNYGFFNLSMRLNVIEFIKIINALKNRHENYKKYILIY